MLPLWYAASTATDYATVCTVFTFWANAGAVPSSRRAAAGGEFPATIGRTVGYMHKPSDAGAQANTARVALVNAIRVALSPERGHRGVLDRVSQVGDGLRIGLRVPACGREIVDGWRRYAHMGVDAVDIRLKRIPIRCLDWLIRSARGLERDMT